MEIEFRLEDQEYLSALKVSSGAARGRVNKAWVAAPPEWRCPSCSRSKRECVSAGVEGSLIAKIEFHHDHIEDFPVALAIANQIRGVGRWERFQQHTFRSFPRTPICFDCNQTDALLKRDQAGAISKWFSLTPGEIASCISPGRNRPHHVELANMIKTWHHREAGHRASLGLIEKSFEQIRAAIVGLSYEETHERLLSIVPASPEFQLDEIAGVPLRATWVDLNSHNSPPKAFDGSRPRVRAAIPTEEQARKAVRQLNAEWWEKAPEDWVCPACARTKFQTIRVSKKGRWTCGITYVQSYESELRDEIEHYRLHQLGHQHPIIREGLQFCICTDCADVNVSLNKVLGPSEDRRLPLDHNEIRLVLKEVDPHQMHSFDMELAKEIAFDKWHAYGRSVGELYKFKELLRKLEGLRSELVRIGAPEREREWRIRRLVGEGVSREALQSMFHEADNMMRPWRETVTYSR